MLINKGATYRLLKSASYTHINMKEEFLMCDKNDINTLINCLNRARMILYDLQVFIKFGALASDSNIIDENLQLNKGSDDYYIFFRTLNKKLMKAIKILQID